MNNDQVQLVPHSGMTPALQQEYQAESCTLVLFGAGGDLARRKLFPALYQLHLDGLLPEKLSVVGTARTQRTREEFLEEMRAGMQPFLRTGGLDEAAWSRLAERIDYVALDYQDPDGWGRLKRGIGEAANRCGAGANRLYYLATPPSAVPEILERLSGKGLLTRLDPLGEKRWDRVIFEKPFGRDLESSERLNQQAARHMSESQIYRIDHYLGKETVQNILVFRFANAIFEPIWNRQHISHVEITAAEKIGVEGRGGFYDETGVLRDIVQNHLLQVLALVAMEPPVSFGADHIRDEKVKVFQSLRRLVPDEVAQLVIRGQYEGYLDEPGVPADSKTPTYMAMRANVDNWRWRDVPFYVRAGKGLAAKRTEVSISFKRVPHCLFGDQSQCPDLQDNVLKLRLQPDEGISLSFASKVPGVDMRVGGFTMDFKYASSAESQPREAYERLLLNSMQGDATLFSRRDGVEESWRFVMPILDAWQTDERIPLHRYALGTSGPKEAHRLASQEGDAWEGLSR